jgi:hypothetical protein
MMNFDNRKRESASGVMLSGKEPFALSAAKGKRLFSPFSQAVASDAERERSMTRPRSICATDTVAFFIDYV